MLQHVPLTLCADRSKRIGQLLRSTWNMDTCVYVRGGVHVQGGVYVQGSVHGQGSMSMQGSVYVQGCVCACGLLNPFKTGTTERLLV